MELAKRIVEEANKSKDEIIELTRKLIRVPSYSGDARTLSQIAQIISEEMKRMNFSVELIEAEKGLSNVIGTFRGSADALCLLFNGHTDVVPAQRGGDWTVEPFGAEIKEGRIYGRGACDMKGGLAAMLAAARIAFRLFPEYKGNLILTATVDEEIGGFKGLKYVVERGIKADMGIVCEPSALKIVNVCKGLLQLRLRTKGKSAHGGVPEQGVNAISKMMKILNRLEGHDFGQTPHKVLGRPTVNIGRIGGGQKPNVVPDSCEAEIDIRYLPGKNHRQIIDDVERAIAELKKEDRQINTEIEIIRYRSSLEIAQNLPVIKAIMEAGKGILGEYLELRGMITPGDSEYLVNAGIPSIIFGPGDEHLAHSANEWIAINDILTAAEIYAAVMINAQAPR
jgi:succinyl-diaminopimelate desuccinylase